MKLTVLTLLVFAMNFAQAQATAEYKRLTPGCKSCNEVEKLTQQYNTELSPDGRLKIALQIARIIQGINLKGKSKTDQMREIHFAMNASLEVLPDDFDSETVVRLLDLRGRGPQVFDQVLWRFPLGQQQKLIERMRAFKEDKVRPNAKIPEAKVIE